MIPNLDWMHGLALAVGAVATAFFPKKAAMPNGTATLGSQHPLFDSLIRVLEGKLTDLIHIEPGPNGEPMFTLRVVLVQDTNK